MMLHFILVITGFSDLEVLRFSNISTSGQQSSHSYLVFPLVPSLQGLPETIRRSINSRLRAGFRENVVYAFVLKRENTSAGVDFKEVSVSLEPEKLRSAVTENNLFEAQLLRNDQTIITIR